MDHRTGDWGWTAQHLDYNSNRLIDVSLLLGLSSIFSLVMQD